MRNEYTASGLSRASIQEGISPNLAAWRSPQSARRPGWPRPSGMRPATNLGLPGHDGWPHRRSRVARANGWRADAIRA